MRKLIVSLMIASLMALLTVATAVPAFAQGAGDGVEKCRGVAASDLFPGGGVVVVSDVDTGDVSGDGDAIRELTVTVTHGPNTSTEVITYEDNDDSGSLTCGDTIISNSPTV